MEKTILVIAMSIITVNLFAFAHKQIRKAEHGLFDTGHTKKNDTVRIATGSVIEIEGMTIDYNRLKTLLSNTKTGLLPLMVEPNWISSAYEYMQTSRNSEFTGKDLEWLKEPLMPYLKYMQQLLKR